MEKVGTYLRSDTEFVLLTVEKITKDFVHCRVADSDFMLEGPKENWDGFKKQLGFKVINEDEFKKYLKTNKQDIYNLQKKERHNKVTKCLGSIV